MAWNYNCFRLMSSATLMAGDYFFVLHPTSVNLSSQVALFAADLALLDTSLIKKLESKAKTHWRVKMTAMKIIATAYALTVMTAAATLTFKCQFHPLVVTLVLFPFAGCIGFMGYVFKRKILIRSCWRFVLYVLTVELVLPVLVALALILEHGFRPILVSLFIYPVLIFPLIRALIKYNSSNCLTWLSNEEIAKGEVLIGRFDCTHRIEGFNQIFSDVDARYHQVIIERRGKVYHVELLRIRRDIEIRHCEIFENLPAVVHFVEEHSLVEIDALHASDNDLAAAKSSFLKAVQLRFPAKRCEPIAPPKAVTSPPVLSEKGQQIKLTLLGYTSGAMTICGGLLLSLPFLLSMAPTVHDTIAENPKAKVYRDLEPGQFRCWNDGFKYSGGSVICIYHRSDAQIQWLINSPAPSFSEPNHGLSSVHLDPHLRSIKPEYFIFSVNRNESETHCTDSGVCTNTPNDYFSGFLPLWGYGWDRYTDMVFFNDELDGFDLHGGIYLSMYREEHQPKPTLVYDLAGRLQGGSVQGRRVLRYEMTLDALTIPPHYYDENDDLILNHSPTYSYANRIMVWLKEKQG